MQLRVGDRFTDETGEWEIIIRPYATVDGKTFHARVRRVDRPQAAGDPAIWSAYERITVSRRAGSE